MRTGRVQPLPPISTCFGANGENMTILRHDANEEGPVLLVLPFNTTQTGRGQSPSSLFQHNANSEGMTVTPLVILPFLATQHQWGGVNPRSTREGPPTGYSEASLILFLFY